MELRNIKTFVCVAEQCSFSKAANLLGYSQSTISSQIQQLEQEFGTLLFERIHKTVRLTESGAQFMGYAKEMLKTAEDARKAMSGIPDEGGELRMAMAESLCISLFPEILEIYKQKYPRVELRINTGNTDDFFYKLYHNETDMVYTLDKKIYSNEMVSELEKEEEVYFVASPNHPAAKGRHSIEETINFDFILTERNMSYRKQLDQFFAENSLEIRPFLELGNVHTIRKIVERGNGVSFLPEFAIRDSLERGSLVKLDIDMPKIKVWRQLLYHRNKWVTPQMQAMIDVIKQFEN